MADFDAAFDAALQVPPRPELRADLIPNPGRVRAWRKRFKAWKRRRRLRQADSAPTPRRHRGGIAHIGIFRRKISQGLVMRILPAVADRLADHDGSKSALDRIDGRGATRRLPRSVPKKHEAYFFTSRPSLSSTSSLGSNCQPSLPAPRSVCLPIFRPHSPASEKSGLS